MRDSPVGMVAIGASLGGLHACGLVLNGLPEDLREAVVVVQHRQAESDPVLAGLLGARCRLPVIEPDDKEPLRGGHVYVAPSNYHLLVESDARSLALSIEEPLHFARPSVDVFLTSAARAFGPRLIAVMLTGSSADGAEGAEAVQRHGGRVVVQNPSTAESSVAPRAVLTRIRPDAVVDLPEISGVVAAMCRRAPN